MWYNITVSEVYLFVTLIRNFKKLIRKFEGKKMRKLTALFLAVAVMFVLTGCEAGTFSSNKLIDSATKTGTWISDTPRSDNPSHVQSQELNFDKDGNYYMVYYTNYSSGNTVTGGTYEVKGDVITITTVYQVTADGQRLQKNETVSATFKIDGDILETVSQGYTMTYKKGTPSNRWSFDREA